MNFVGIMIVDKGKAHCILIGMLILVTGPTGD